MVVHLMAHSVHQKSRLISGHKVGIHCAITGLFGSLVGGRRQSCITCDTQETALNMCIVSLLLH